MEKTAQASKTRHRVIIVDRDSMGADLLANALGRDRGCYATATLPSRLFHELAASKADLVVIASDVSSEPGSGFELAEQVSRAYPETPIVLLLNPSNHEMVIRAFRAGARGVFSRQQPMSEFLDCVQHMSKGFLWAGRQETDNLREALQNLPAPGSVLNMESSALTSRELQVVRLAATGKTNKAIARELMLSEHTVKNYLFRAFDKLGVGSRVELLYRLTTPGATAPDSRWLTAPMRVNSPQLAPPKLRKLSHSEA